MKSQLRRLALTRRAFFEQIPIRVHMQQNGAASLAVKNNIST